MVDGLPKWNWLIRAGHLEQRWELAVPLIFADLSVHLHRRLVGQHEDFCFWNHSASLIDLGGSSLSLGRMAAG